MDVSIDSILVPTDGSEGATAGARRGIDLAARLDADLHVLSVVDTRETDTSSLDLDAEEGAQPEEQLQDAAERAVEEVAGIARTNLAGRITTAVEHGVPFETINRYVDGHGIDLVVMGTRGRTGLERALLGSVAEKTLRTASVPVVMVPAAADAVESGSTYKNVLLPTDGSEGAEIAIHWGVALARAFDATLHTVYSVDTGAFAPADGLDAMYDALEEAGRRSLETVREHARSTDVSVAGNLASGPAARTILSYSEEQDIDLIVMGTHGRSGVRRYLIGSVTETVVRNAAVPVCCVPMEPT